MRITINIPPGGSLEIASAECGEAMADLRHANAMLTEANEQLRGRIRGMEFIARDHQRDLNVYNEAWEKLEADAERAAKVEDLAKRMIGWTHELGGGNWVQFENEARELGVIL